MIGTMIQKIRDVLIGSHQVSMSRLALEVLEDRYVPAVYLWNPADDARPLNQWSTKNNWDLIDQVSGVPGYQAAAFPGVGDTVYFNANPGYLRFGTNRDCYVDVFGGVTISKITIYGDYSKNIIMTYPLTIAGGMSSFSSSAATIRGSAPEATPARGTLNLNDESFFTFQSGSFADTTVNIGRNSTLLVDGRLLDGSIGGTRNIAGSDIRVNSSGILAWPSGNVSVVSPLANSNIYVNSGGTFAINANGGIWGMNAPTLPAYFKVVNNGTVRLNATGTAAIVGDYETTRLTRLDMGILYIDGKAEQTAGTFELRGNTTVKVVGTGSTLGIRGGSIVGQGTVDGNLVLGYDLAVDKTQSTNATISPGLLMGVGTLTITSSFQIFSGNMNIKVTATGAYDKVVVLGQYAALGGTLLIGNAVAYNPGRALVNLPFLRAKSFVGDFASKSFSNNVQFFFAPRQTLYGWRILKGITSYSFDWSGSQLA